MHEAKENTRPQTELNRAMLALLVAADQRCPAIIGHAHLLYHAGAERARLDPVEAVAQLKSDAEDLLDAIIAAEAALRIACPTAAPASAE